MDREQLAEPVLNDRHELHRPYPRYCEDKYPENGAALESKRQGRADRARQTGHDWIMTSSLPPLPRFHCGGSPIAA